MSSGSLLPICFECQRFKGIVPDVGWSCEAFKTIPTDILASVKDHREPVDGDGGLRFKPKEGEDMAPSMATDPPVSEAQRRAMFAAKAGHSTLGIPQSVGSEFASADPGGKLPEHVGKDLAPEKFSAIQRALGFLKEFFGEEQAEPEHGGEDAWDRKGRAASVAFTTHDGRVLLLKRADDDQHRPGEWCFPGGKANDGEEFEECARREAKEEVGDCTFDGLSELERCRTPGDFEHATYVVPVEDAFEPKLSKEHSDWTWAPVTALPEKTHPGVATAIDKVIGPDALSSAGAMAAAHSLREQGRDESEETKKRAEGKLSEKTHEEIGTVGSSKREDIPDSDFLLPSEKKYPVKKEGKYDRGLLLAAAREARMHGHPDLASRADKIREREFAGSEDAHSVSAHTNPYRFDRAADMAMDWVRSAELAAERREHSEWITLAFDRESVRDKDADGRLHVSQANISKGNVCPYYGKEIPDCEALGLDPERKYMLLRDPKELKKSVPTWNNLPILSDHVPVTADSFPQDKIIGSTGTDSEFKEPYLINSLAFWPQDAIDGIESNEKKELSAGYRYRADMTPGEFKGVHYDGVMRDIKGNHLALVREGRAGSDVVVGDAALGSDEEREMALQLTPKAAMAAGVVLGWYNANKSKTAGMAMDTAAALINPIFSGITSKNYGAQVPAMAAAVHAVLKGKLANDVSIEDVTTLIGALQGAEAGADTTTEANAGLPSYMKEEEADADDETPEEKEEDEGCDRRADDARRRMGRDESEEEREEREEREESEDELSEEEDPPSGREPNLIGDWRHADDLRRDADDMRRRADDSRRADDRRAADAADRRARDAKRMSDDMKRAADAAKRRMGRDESEEEREEREKKAEDVMRMHARDRARDRRRLGRDYRRARDAHRTARDAHRKAVMDYRRAHDGHKAAMDGRRADDAASCAQDMKRADDEARECHDRMMKARDARHRARDARRAHDKRFGRDEPSPFEGRPNVGGTMDRAAMDAAIAKQVDERVAAAVRDNDRRHADITNALRTVRSKVGDIAMDSTIHGAADVFDRALTVLGVEHAGIRDAVALKRLFELAPRPGGGERRDNGFAHDAAPATAAASFKKFFPGASSIERV